LYCSNCGEKLIDDSVFCHACGAEVHDGEGKKTNAFEQTSRTNVDMAYSGQESKGTMYVVFGWILFGLTFAFFLCQAWLPIVCGIAAIVMGYFIYIYRSKPHGIVLMALALFGTIFSVALGHLVKMIIYRSLYF